MSCSRANNGKVLSQRGFHQKSSFLKLSWYLCGWLGIVRHNIIAHVYCSMTSSTSCFIVKSVFPHATGCYITCWTRKMLVQSICQLKSSTLFHNIPIEPESFNGTTRQDQRNLTENLIHMAGNARRWEWRGTLAWPSDSQTRLLCSPSAAPRIHMAERSQCFACLLVNHTVRTWSPL